MPPVTTEPLSSLSPASGAPAVVAPAAAAVIAPIPPVPATQAPSSVGTTAPVSPAPAVVDPNAPKRFADPEAKVEAPAAVVPPVVAPVVEEWTLAAPKDVTVAEPTLKEVTDFAKANKLTKDVAEKVLARDLARDLAAETARATAAAKNAESIGNVWYEQTMAHPEIGGVHAKVAEANFNRGMLMGATPDERKAVYGSPFVNNTIFRAIVHRLTKLIPVEDGVPPISTKAPPAANTQSPQQRIYGKN